LQAICEHGLRVDSFKGDFVVQPAQATDDPEQVGVVDVVLVGVKAWQVSEAAKAIHPMVGRDTFVVPLQNGVEAASQLTAVLGEQHVLGGFCRVGSHVEGPGYIRHVGADPYVAFGELDNQPSQRTEELRQAFARSVGVTAEIPSDIQAATWRKFLFIASLSGVGAVTRAPVGIVRGIPEARQLLEGAMHEVLTVAQSRGVVLPDEAVGRALSAVDDMPPAVTTSMQRDILEGRPSELAWQNGAVVRLGQELGVATPVHSFIYRSLWPLELRARGQVEFPTN
jgi:2-dehydropantoate 2-reductase